MKQSLQSVLKAALGIASAVSFAACAGGSSTDYVWSQAYTGGGGYIVGFEQSPFEDNVFYARCDVAGVFKSVDGGKTWDRKNKDLKRWYNHSVRSIAFDPTQEGVMFRCSGDIRDGKFAGSIHKSVDGGESWYEVCTDAYYFGNGPTRMDGEVIIVDPKDPKRVFTADYCGKILLSRDGGESWEVVYEDDDDLFTSVKVSPKGVYYVLSDYGTILASEDKGETWKVRSRNKGLSIRDLVFVEEGGREKMVFSTNERIKISWNGGKHLKSSNKGLPAAVSGPGIFQSGCLPICVDPNDQSVLYTSIYSNRATNYPSIPIYKSEDYGASWRLIANHTLDDVKNKPSYYKDVRYAGYAVAKIRVDRSNSNHILFSNWYGVTESYDGGLTYDANEFKGLETCCLEYIECNKANPSQVVFTLADHFPMRSEDSGESYAVVGSGKYISCTAMSFSKYDPNFLLFAQYTRLKDYGVEDKYVSTLYAQRNGEVISEIDLDNTYVQSMAEDIHNKGTFYALVDGKVDVAAGLYRYSDWGSKIEKMPFPFPSSVVELPVNKNFIEDELLNIVTGQVKNVCGCNQHLAVDPFKAGTIYAGEWSTGIFKTEDGGESWSDITGDLPILRDTASVLTSVKVDPKREGWLYAGFIKEGLWRSKDGGASWSKVFPLTDEDCNITSLSIGGVGGDEICIGGENLYWSEAPVAVYLSSDLGKSFTNITDDSLGALRIKGVDINPESGRIYVVTSGNSAFYVDRVQK